MNLDNRELVKAIERMAGGLVESYNLHPENHDGWVVIDGKIFQVRFEEGCLVSADKELKNEIPADKEFIPGKPYSISDKAEQFFSKPVEDVLPIIQADGFVEFLCDPKTRRSLIRANLKEVLHPNVDN